MSQLSTLGTALRCGAFAVVLALSVQAQQFQVQPGAIPGVARWSEGVEAVDVDLDGDLDLCFADGDGFSSPLTKRQCVLVINKLIETGPGVYADESVARLGVNLCYGKGVTSGDVNGDGWPDLLYVSAFNADPPFLFINQGAANPGFFTLESASRGLTTAYSSSGAQFGDLDLDGDLDLVLCDSGASLLGAPGGKPHLFVNDGTGHFTEDAAALGAPTKRAHMDVQLVDVDNDWDLDFLGACRSSNSGGNHYLMLNNGAATFSNASSLVPSGSSSTYEIEVGDLDGDTDLDLFFVSISSLSEGVARNELVPGPGLAFTALPSLAGVVDDNEILLLDYDGDDDQDAFVGSLGTREDLWRNDGGLAFTNRAVDIQAVNDSTLDMTAADLDNDGDYDLVTAQGESNPGQWENKIYLNSGPADVLPPTVTAVKGPPGVLVGDPIVVLARVRDQVMDDGVSYVGGFARWVVDPGHAPAGVTVDGAGFSPPSIVVPAGTTVTWTHGGGGAQSVTSATAPWTFDSGPFASGSYSYTFVTPGTYDVTSTPSGAMGQVVVTGVANETDGTHAGGGMHRFALPSPSVRMAALAIYRGALRDAAADARLTPEEDSTLTSLQQQLGLSQRDLANDLPQLSRLRMLARVAAGNMPDVTAPVPLVPDERCYWVVQSTIAERIPLPDSRRRPLAGVPFPVMSAEPFAASGERGQLRPAADILPSDIGVLIVTSRRTIFQGARRTISVPHARAEHLELYADGVRLDEIGQTRSRYFLLDDPELACAIMLQAARMRRAEIRPARATRSA